MLEPYEGKPSRTVLRRESGSNPADLAGKISTADGKGIPGVSFILYDSSHNPIGQYTSDDRGYVYIEDLESGRYYLRELENEGYVPDTQKKTVYVKSGETTEIEWENSATRS